MIAKAVKGKSFRGALEYDLTREGSQVLDTNMAGVTPQELGSEFGEMRKLRPNLGKAVLHVSLSAAPGEKLSDGQWCQIARRYIDAMGLEKNQFIVTRHRDTAHEHIHILANRIQFDGNVTSDSQDYRRQETLMRELERDYGLQRVALSREAERKAPTRGEIERNIRTGEPSTKQQLQQLCDGAAKGCSGFGVYLGRLEALGVEVVPVVQLEGAKLSGLSYRLEGETMKGSDLGKAYSPAGLAKRGVTYEQDRDFAAVRASVEREAARALSGADRDSTTDQAQERGGVDCDDRTVSAGDGRADGRDPANASRNPAHESGAGRDVQSPNIEINRNGQESRSGSRESRGSLNFEALRASPANGSDFGGARERIMALSGIVDRGETSRSGSVQPRETPQNRTFDALTRQITALHVPRFEVGIRAAKTGQMMNREWSRAELEHSCGWLKRMNAKGNDVYIRPAGEHGLVLVDDLSKEKISRMCKDGFVPAATIETSPGNYQAWVKLSENPLPAETRRIAAQELAQQYGGDMNSADSRHYGRLAGFTNQKPQHTREGRQPYVLAHDCPGGVATAAPARLERIEQGLDREARKDREARLKAIEEVSTGLQTFNPVREYRRQAQRLINQYGAKADLSRMDWMIATDMAKSGDWIPKDIEMAIREASPALESRKAGHIEDYAQRTAERAWEASRIERQQQNSQEKIQQNSQEKIQQNSQEKIQQNSQEKIQQNSQEKIQQNSQEKIQQNSQEKIQQNSQEKIQQNSQEKIQQNSQEKIQQNSQEKIQQNSQEKIQQNSQEKIQQNSQEKIQQNSQEKIQQNSQEKIQQNSQEKEPVRRQKIQRDKSLDWEL